MMQLWQGDSPRELCVPGCRGITCRERLRTGRKKEGRFLWKKALCDPQCEPCMDWNRNSAGMAQDCRNERDFCERCFYCPKASEEREKGLVLPQGDKRGITWWDRCPEGVTLHIPVLPVISSPWLGYSARALAASTARAAFLEALQCELPWPGLCSSQLPQTPILNPSVVSFWLGKGGAWLQWQHLDSLFAGWTFWVPAMVFPSSGHPPVTKHLPFPKLDWCWETHQLNIRVRAKWGPFFSFWSPQQE